MRRSAASGRACRGRTWTPASRRCGPRVTRLRDAMARNAGKVSYTYDLGACWEHEITLEQTLPRDRGQDYPVCVADKGDSPVEYWCEDDPEEPEPFDLAEVNRKLAALGGAEE